MARQTNIHYLQFKHIDVPVVQTYLLDITTQVGVYYSGGPYSMF